MNELKNIKSLWKERNLPVPPKDGSEEVIKKSKIIKRKQTIGQVVLFITALILVWFFFYVSAYDDQQLAIGLYLMIGSLTLRILIEFIYKLKLSKFNVTQEVDALRDRVREYYKSRLWIHYLVTPFLFILYIVGFVLLLPSFKATLSSGFYLYILISSIVIFIALGVFIAYHIKREMDILKNMNTNGT